MAPRKIGRTPRARRVRVTDLDQAIKELLKSYPADTLEFLLPDAAQEWGRPTAWEFLNTGTRKHDLGRKGYVMDLNIRYTFGSKQVVLVILIEHWSTARSVNLHRTAHYFLDLLERFPGEEVVPVALVTDPVPSTILNCVHAESRGHVWLHFETLLREVSREESSAWAGARNAIGHALRGAMAGADDRVERTLAAAEALWDLLSPEEGQRLFPLVAEVGKLTQKEVEAYMKKRELTHSKVMDWLGAHKWAEGMERGIELGLRASKLEDARKMLERGCDWDFITSITGIKPEDLAAEA